MKAMLKISLLLNGGLFSGLIFVLAAGRMNHSPAAPPVQMDSTPAAAAPVPATTVPAEGEARPFTWSQIESSDYGTYIANLRRIECPEQTIRDLIMADVDSLYASRREPLKQNMPGSDFAGRLALEQDLQALRDEETSLITALLGAPPGAAATARSPRTWPGSPDVVSLPLAFQDVDPSAVKLSAEHAEALAGLRQRFMEEIGGANQDPSDPAYRERWQKAQPEIDDLMRGMIGINAYQDYQLAVWAKGEEPKPSTP
jgi:hypothetical protein